MVVTGALSPPAGPADVVGDGIGLAGQGGAASAAALARLQAALRAGIHPAGPYRGAPREATRAVRLGSQPPGAVVRAADRCALNRVRLDFTSAKV